MAGFKVVWANEFVPAAQESYRANMSSDAILDCRDIRLVQPEEILQATGLARGELDLFDGSPPCQAFSTAGKREKGWGHEKTYEHGASQCNETLFDEYIRLLRGLNPKTFVAENVSGLVKGTAKGWFIEVLRALKASGYRVTARLLDAQWLGVPQMRQRIIFVGVREDLHLDPAHPEPLPYRYSVRDALPHLTAVKSVAHGYTREDTLSLQKPAPSLTMTNGASYQQHHVQSETMLPGDRDFPVTELTGRVGGQFKRKRISLDGPLNTVNSSGAAQQRFELSGRAVHNTGGDPKYSAGDITDSAGTDCDCWKREPCSRRGQQSLPRCRCDRTAEVHHRGAAAHLRVPGRLHSHRDLRAAVGAARELGSSADDESHRRDGQG
jgi:DNA (cytosine-5)-methyltransferase 1